MVSIEASGYFMRVAGKTIECFLNNVYGSLVVWKLMGLESNLISYKKNTIILS